MPNDVKVLALICVLLQVGLLLFGLGLPMVAGLLLWHNRKRLDDWDFAWKVRAGCTATFMYCCGACHTAHVVACTLATWALPGRCGPFLLSSLGCAAGSIMLYELCVTASGCRFAPRSMQALSL
jgi:hypothetical protein